MTTATKTTEPAKIPGVKRKQNPKIGLRSITMLRPICKECTANGITPGWWETCPHDPYVGQRQKTTKVPIYSEPLEDGTVTLERVEDRISWEVRPHLVDAAVAMQVNSGQGVERARRKGRILPTELRTTAYPNGIAPFCEFAGCRNQEGLRLYRWGTFCSELEARLVGQTTTDSTGNLIYGARETLNEGKRRRQLDAVPVEVSR